MEVIKRKILLENSINRTSNNKKTWGTLTATTFYIKVLLTQNVDDMGLFVDSEYIPYEKTTTPVDYTILKNKLVSLNINFPFMSGATNPIFTPNNTTYNYWKVLRYPTNVESNYYNFSNVVITGATDSRIEDVRSYSVLNPFRTNFDVSTETYVNYDNITVNGVDRIKSMGEPKIYVFDTKNDANLGTNNQIYGLLFNDYTGVTRSVVIEDETQQIPLTTFRYIGEGLNQTNVSLSALTKEEYLFGIISPPEIQNDVFIDRGITIVMDRHLKLSEITNLDALENYGNGFYKLNKQ
jgi:hypothetical protein